MTVRLKRVYEPREEPDGLRVLVMRRWPRGIRKERVDLWLKELGADLDLLRDWKAGRVTWPERRKRYLDGLRAAAAAAQVLLAWDDPERIHRGLQNAAFSAAELSAIRRRGWAQSVGEREQGVASVSAPVRSPSGKIIAAVSVSGPLERLSRQPGRMHAPAVLAAAERLSESLRRAAAADAV